MRGSVIDTWSAWDANHEVIFTYATVRVSRYFGETTGPDTLVVREVGGTVDGYTQEAIGFPAIRRGENVVLFLSEWENSTDLRIHAYNQGKYLVRMRADRSEVLISDPVKQGEERQASSASPHRRRSRERPDDRRVRRHGGVGTRRRDHSADPQPGIRRTNREETIDSLARHLPRSSSSPRPSRPWPTCSFPRAAAGPRRRSASAPTTSATPPSAMATAA